MRLVGQEDGAHLVGNVLSEKQTAMESAVQDGVRECSWDPHLRKGRKQDSAGGDVGRQCSLVR